MDNFKELQSSISAALVATTRSAGAVASEDLSFHRSLDASLGTTLDQQNARLLDLANRLLGAATTSTEIVRPPRLKDLENVEDNWRAVVDVVDSLLERADTALDEFTGAVKRLSPGIVDQVGVIEEKSGQNGGLTKQQMLSKTSKSSRTSAAARGSDMLKPQLSFEHVPTNTEDSPFKPLLVTKPHASTPLATEPITTETTPTPHYPHPYQQEIEDYRYPSSLYIQKEPVLYHPFNETSAIFVDTEKALEEMLQELRQASEIAIDLEHHDSRSFIGIVSLMQISTRNQDWIVDTLKPWRRKLQCLNEVFANPNILKVLHGAYMDIIWLQRDLGLYLVGLFDTHYAARALGYSGGSLAFLLKKFADVDAQKQYQMADWRIRPLPQELLDYARSDTHYLLYIFDCMRNELIERSDFSVPDHEKDKIWSVLEKSSEIALQRYEHPIYDAELGQGATGWYKLLSRTPALLSKKQFAVFRAVHKWRDDVAREQDDSTNYIMPNHNIFTVAKALPTTRAELLNLVHPATKTVRERAGELMTAIIHAIETGDDGPDMIEVLNKIDPRSSRKSNRKVASSPVASAVPAISNAASTNVTALAITSALPLRSSTSSFWGSVWNRVSRQQTRQASTSTNNIDLSIPLPHLNSEVFASADDIAAQASETTASPTPAFHTAPETEEDKEKEDVFILKQLSGKKRKHQQSQAHHLDGMAAQSDEVSLSPSSSSLSLDARARRKAEKAERKRARREGRGDISANQGTKAEAAEEELAPFDYASAPSILNPPQEDYATMKDRKKKERQLNPYAKALDTSKGLARAQKERAGRSMTFKN